MLAPVFSICLFNKRESVSLDPAKRTVAFQTKAASDLEQKESGMASEMTETMWRNLLAKMGSGEREIQTVPLSGGGKWFTVQAANGKILVSAGKRNEPKSKVSPRIISKEEFFTMYPIYVRRCAGERVSQEAQAATRSQVYIYAIFANFCK